MHEARDSDRIPASAADSVDAVVTAVTGHRPVAARQALAAAAESLGPGPCIDVVLMPAIRRIARLPRNAVGVTDIALAVETARAWLETVVASAPPPHERPPVVLACGPGDRHSLGIEALTMLLRFERQPCRMLGVRVTAGRMSVAVKVNRPAGVVLVIERESGHRAGVDVLRSLHDLGTSIFYAGGAFDTSRARQDVPGTYLGNSFQGACTTVLSSLSVPWGGRSPASE